MNRKKCPLIMERKRYEEREAKKKRKAAQVTKV